MNRKTIGLLIIVLLITFVIMSSFVEKEAIKKEAIKKEANIIIESYSITLDDVILDKLYLDNVKVSLRNEGDAPAEIDKIVLSSGKSKIENTLIGSLNLGEEKVFSLSTYTFLEDTPLERMVGANEVKGMISVIDISGETLAEENISIQVPVARIGDIIPEVEYTHNLSLTLLSWKESKIAVDGHYTFTAKPGMKFVILIFKFRNNWIRPQETPYLNKGEIATNKGYIYPTWDASIFSEGYKPRKATDEEVKMFVGDSGGYEKLLPDESIVGRAVYEIPKGETPIEANIMQVSPIIKYGEG